MRHLRTFVNWLIKKIGGNMRITLLPPDAPFTGDMEMPFRELYQACSPYTMTSVERMYAVYKAAEHVVRNNIPGDFVECGVWRGGCAMMAALTFQKFGDTRRNIYLYDTYEGMTQPSDKDVKHNGERPEKKWQTSQHDAHNDWCYSSLNEVKSNLARTKYPREQLIFVKGKVEETLPETAPEQIAILRLDTDWYESTKHELIHLYPKLSSDGVLLLDDYGHWQGAKQATDEYIEEHKLSLILHRIDYTGRSATKR